MKLKIFVLFVLLATVVLFSCGEKEAADGAGDDVAETSAESTTEEKTDPPTEATTEDPGPKIIKDYVELFENPDQEAVSANGAGISIAMYFSTDLTLYSISFECPSWSDDIGQMTLELYAWDTDYETTIAGTPLLFETDLFTDYSDNETIELDLPEGMFGPGEYLYAFRDGKDGVGMWKSKDSVEGVQSYFKGNPVAGVYKTYLYGWKYAE